MQEEEKRNEGKGARYMIICRILTMLYHNEFEADNDFSDMTKDLICSMPVLGSYMDLVRPGWGNKWGRV